MQVTNSFHAQPKAYRILLVRHVVLLEHDVCRLQILYPLCTEAVTHLQSLFFFAQSMRSALDTMHAAQVALWAPLTTYMHYAGLPATQKAYGKACHSAPAWLNLQQLRFTVRKAKVYTQTISTGWLLGSTSRKRSTDCSMGVEQRSQAQVKNFPCSSACCRTLLGSYRLV